MGLFGASPKVPSTISDKKMEGLRRRAEKAQPDSMFSKRQVARRHAAAKQRSKSRWS
jgi:hypothetical protein